MVRTILEDPKNADLLYLGTETGLWVSHNRGGQWTRVKANLPTTPIYEMKIHPRDNDLILATHARGIWILDDVGIIQQWAKAEAAGSVRRSIPSRRWPSTQANDKMKGFEGDMQFLGLNPAPGATLAYRLQGRREGRELGDPRRQPAGARDHRRRDARPQHGRPAAS